MKSGGNMKGSRLADVLDETPLDKTKWDIIFGKLKKLGTAIEMHYGPSMDIDNLDYRWVNDRIEYYESDERLLTRDEMLRENDLLSKYGK